jgi:hypothetical protein
MSTASSRPESDRITFPALLPAEIAVWRAWLALHQTEYSSFDYNVRVGPGFDPGTGVEQFVRDSAMASTRKRIDAVAWQGDQPTIIEVKDRAGLSAIGQLLGYIVHWKIERPNSPPPRRLLVANRLAPGVQEVLQEHSLPFELVNP